MTQSLWLFIVVMRLSTGQKTNSVDHDPVVRPILQRTQKVLAENENTSEITGNGFTLKRNRFSVQPPAKRGLTCDASIDAMVNARRWCFFCNSVYS